MSSFFFFAVYSLWIAHALWKFVESAHFVHLFEVETNQFPCTWLEIELKKKMKAFILLTVYLLKQNGPSIE